jgi:hypothetical protein
VVVLVVAVEQMGKLGLIQVVMEVFTVVGVDLLLVTVTLEGEQCALYGQEQLVHSHQQIQVIYNEPLYRN